jgi:DNA-binding response OmpR family regulator
MQRVLLVEDDDAFRIFCRIALEGHGFQVLEARDGSVGVEMALRDHPDIIILDLWLPGLTGSAALRVMRTDPRLDRIPIVVLSGVPEVKDRDGLFAFGADEVIEKPIPPGLLAEAIKSRLRLGRAPARRRENRGVET